MIKRIGKMRLAISALVLVNLLFFIWNYSFPYVNPLIEQYRPPPSLTQLTLVANQGADEPAGSDGEEEAGQTRKTDAADEAGPPAVEAEPPAADSEVFVCGTIGPMLNAEEQTSVLSIMSLETNAELTVRVDKNKRDLSYWVMIPPLESLTEARAHMRKLAENALNESFIVTDEEHRNAISLGVFRSKEKAQKLLDRALALNLETKPQMVARGSHNYWVDFKSEVSRAYYTAIGDLLKRKKHLQHTESNCPD